VWQAIVLKACVAMKNVMAPVTRVRKASMVSLQMEPVPPFKAAKKI
jgi:hypothetical protein